MKKYERAKIDIFELSPAEKLLTGSGGEQSSGGGLVEDESGEPWSPIF